MGPISDPSSDDDNHIPFDFKENSLTNNNNNNNKIIMNIRSPPTPVSSTLSSSSSAHKSNSYYDYHRRIKLPIKPALKNGKAQSLSINSTFTSSSTNHSSPMEALPTAVFDHALNNQRILSPFSTSLPCTQHRHSSRRAAVNYEEEYDDTWRKDGKELRRKLIEEDDATGGSQFVINKQCKLKNYCAIADRVQDQFQATYEEGDKLEESFIMGNRLIKFLSDVLPTHHHYYSKHPEFTKLRIKTQNNLLKVRKQMDDISYRFDKEIYKNVMNMQGLEFDLSPGAEERVLGKKGRKKKVTFALEENHVQNDDSSNLISSGEWWTEKELCDGFIQKNSKGRDNKKKTLKRPEKGRNKDNKTEITTAKQNKHQEEFDLSMWVNRDPGMEILDCSFSSGETSLSFEGFSSSMQALSKSSSNEQNFDHIHHGFSLSHGFEDRLFDSIHDDGWKSFGSSASKEFEWPEDSFMQSSNIIVGTPEQSSNDDFGAGFQEEEKAENKTASFNDVKCSDADPSVVMIEDEDDEDQSHDSNRSFENDSADEDLYNGLDDLVENESFIEKISRENSSLSINELNEEEEDSDANDSWEDNEEKVVVAAAVVDQEKEEGGDDEKYDEKYDENEVESAKESTSCFKAMSEEELFDLDNISVEEVNELDDSDTEEHLITLHEEFASSFDMANDDDIDFNNHGYCSVDEEHEQLGNSINSMNFDDGLQRCDSSGAADKTVITSATSETDALTADDDSEGSQNLHNKDIVSPDKLDYLEHKVKDLQVQTRNKVKTIAVATLSCSSDCLERNPTSRTIDPSNLNQPLHKSIYPIQMARSDSEVHISSEPTNLRNHNVVTKTGMSTRNVASPIRDPSSISRIKNLRKAAALKRSEGGNHLSPGSFNVNDHNLVTDTGTVTKSVASPITETSSRPHPTAARLKNLKKTTAWKRRYSTSTSQ